MKMNPLCLLLLCACNPQPNESADPAPASGSVQDDWWGQVEIRIHDDARSFHPVSDGAFQANSASFGARLARDGLMARHHEASEGSEPISLRFAAWGREGQVQAVESVPPTLGACVDAGSLQPTGACIRQVERVHPGITEAWTAGGGGLEQSFTVSEGPEGSGLLTLDIATTGADVTSSDDTAWLTDGDGLEWWYTGLLAWDARGEPLASIMETDGSTIRLLVDDTGAAYPVLIDPILTTATSTLTGLSSDQGNFGSAVSSAGDVNGDGYDDVIVGAPDYGYYAVGQVYVYLGSTSGVSTTAATTLTGANSGDSFGTSVSGAGDVNGDGYDDVVVGAPWYYSSYYNHYYYGRVYVFHGSSVGVTTTAATTLTGANQYDYLGYSVSSAGDVNRDGYDDIIVGAYGYSSETGRAYVYHGASSGLATTATTTLSGASSSYEFGYSVSDAGDVNADLYGDVIVGAPGADRAYVYYGSLGGVSTSWASTLSGSSGTDFGSSVCGAGNVNGDLFDDVAVGAPSASSSAGQVTVHAGSWTGVVTTASTTLTGSSSSEFGTNVSGAGDTNRDGYDDLIVGAPSYSSNTGRAYLYAGSSAGLSTTSVTTLTGSSGYHLGDGASDAGDVNNDGYADVIVGARGYGSHDGRAYVHHGYADADGDGYIVGGNGTNQDCNDNDASVHAGTTEIVGDGIDQDCNGGDLCHVDADDDGYRLSTTVASSDLDCTDPGEAAATDPTGDCDDADAAIHPGATEIPADGIDQDCDGAEACYVDADNDGWRLDTLTTSSDGDCADPGEAVTTDPSGDCVDTDAAIHPTATETVADGIDQDCDGTELCHVDADLDGFRTTATMASADLDCQDPGEAPTSADLDCDDSDANVYPGAMEFVADGIDQDCDGHEECLTDADNDGYRVDSTVSSADLDCSDPGEAVSSDPSGDCDDTDATIWPGASDTVADGVDSDCDGSEICYVDADSDGYRIDYLVTSSDGDCADPGEALVSAPSGDCDDLDAASHPTASETTGDGVDQDCDGFEICYVDADDDGFRIDLMTLSANIPCDAPGEGVASDPAGDCEDADPAIHPGAPEICNAIDDDCDGLVDGADPDLAPLTWYIDADGDGYGSKNGTATGCEPPKGHVADFLDCDDTNARINPSGTELCDAVDDDCDGAIDEEATDSIIWYADADGDSYGDPSMAVQACIQPKGSVSDGTDCDDAAAAVNPAATEICNLIDDDCDGAIDEEGGATWYADADGDSFGDPETALTSCDQPKGAVADGTDCEDADAAINPSAEEVCNGLDDDCDGSVDEDLGSTWYTDRDGDGYGDPNTAETGCDQPDQESVTDGTDCDDGDASVFPGADDVPGDGIDQDCDGYDADGGTDTAETGTVKADGGSCGCANGPRSTGSQLALVLALAAGAVLRRRSPAR